MTYQKVLRAVCENQEHIGELLTNKPLLQLLLHGHRLVIEILCMICVTYEEIIFSTK